MKKILSFLFLIFVLVYCKNAGQQISISAVDMNYFTQSQLHDTLDYILGDIQPDLFSFNCQFLSNDCRVLIDKNNFEILNLNNIQDHKFLNQSLILSQRNSFALQSSGEVIFKDTLLNEYENILNWSKLKDNKSGYIFFIFNLTVQPLLKDQQITVLGTKILKKIDEIASGVPVLLISDLHNNEGLSDFITQKWKGLYTLRSVKKGKGKIATFYINDYFIIKNQTNINDNSNHFNELVIKFTMKIKRIKQNEDGVFLF